MKIGIFGPVYLKVDMQLAEGSFNKHGPNTANYAVSKYTGSCLALAEHFGKSAEVFLLTSVGTAGAPHVLHVLNHIEGVDTTFVGLQPNGIGVDLNQYDGVNHEIFVHPDLSACVDSMKEHEDELFARMDALILCDHPKENGKVRRLCKKHHIPVIEINSAYSPYESCIEYVEGILKEVVK